MHTPVKYHSNVFTIENVAKLSESREQSSSSRLPSAPLLARRTLSPTQASAASSSRLPPAPPLARRTSSPTQPAVAAETLLAQKSPKIHPSSWLGRRRGLAQASFNQPRWCRAPSGCLRQHSHLGRPRPFPLKIYFGHFPGKFCLSLSLSLSLALLFSFLAR